MFSNPKMRWLKLNSVLLIFTVLFTTLVPSFPLSEVKAAEKASVYQPQPVELPWYRNETTKVYGNPDGTLTAEVHSEPIHYLKENEWLEIDNTLQETADKQTVTNKNNKFKVKLPKETKSAKDSTHLFDYSIAGKDIQFSLANTPVNKGKAKFHVNPQASKNEFKGNSAKLKNLYPGVTFEYIVDGSKVKENIILDSYQGKNSFAFLIKSQGITAEKKEDGSIEFKDKSSGNFLFTIPRPYMFDSNKEQEGIISQEVTQEIQPTTDGFILTVTADENYLTAPERVYPVTIDPWIDYFNAQDTYIASNYPTYNYHNHDRLYVGHDATIGKTRSLVKWPTLPHIGTDYGWKWHSRSKL